MRMLPLGTSPHQPPRTADGAHRDAVAARADDDADTQSVVFTVGIWFTDLWTAGFALFLLSFPSGRLRSRADRAIVGIFLFVVVPLEFLWLLFWVPENGLNILAIAPDESAAKVVDTIQRALISFGSVLLIIVVLRRWLESSGPVRRQMVPVLVGAAALMLQLTAWLFATVNISLEPLNDLILASQIAIPIAVLYVLLQARMARGAVADLVVEMGPTPTPARLRDALANALGDPSLQVAYWSAAEDRFVDAAGQPMELPDEGTGQAVTMLERNGVPEAAIIHDAVLLDEPGLVASVASAMRLAVENDRLTAEVQAQLEEVRASRARIVEAGDLERQAGRARPPRRRPATARSRSVSSCRSRDALLATVVIRPSDEAWTGHQKRPSQHWPSCAILHSGSIPSSSPRAASGRRSSPSLIAPQSTWRSTSARSATPRR